MYIPASIVYHMFTWKREKNWQNIIALTAADTSGARKKHKNVQACYSTQISNSDGGVRVGDIESELSRIESGVET